MQPVGRCPDADSYVNSLKECSVAFKGIGVLQGTVVIVSTLNSAAAPYGCFLKVSEKRVYFNPSGNKADNNPNHRSICRAEGAFC